MDKSDKYTNLMFNNLNKMIVIKITKAMTKY